jgi:hypothetical protein
MQLLNLTPALIYCCCRDCNQQLPMQVASQGGTSGRASVDAVKVLARVSVLHKESS